MSMTKWLVRQDAMLRVRATSRCARARVATSSWWGEPPEYAFIRPTT
jgi:hypothetical protein